MLFLSSHDHSDNLQELAAAFAFFDLSATAIMDTVLLPVDAASYALNSPEDTPYRDSPCQVLTGS